MVVFHILALVGVDESHVELHVESWQYCVGIAYVECHAVSPWRFVEVLVYEVLELVFNLNGVDLSGVVG